MKKKKIIIYSSIIVLIVLTIILFTTYAFITTKVSGNSSGKKYQAISKVIRIEYSDGKETLSSNINDTFTPGSVITKTFTVTNTGDDEIDYTIYLENVTNTFTRYNDITYELYDSSNTKIYEGIFPKTDNVISDTYKLKKNESTTYTLKVIYNNSEENQIVDSGKKIDAKISFIGATLKNAILASAKTAASTSDATRTIYQETPTTTPGQVVSTETEKTLSKTEDDYGDSYYFRGNVVDNFVNYAGMCWRIVRIQGDGSIKLILASELSCSDSNVTTSSGYATDGAAGVQGTKLSAHYGYKNVVVGSKTYKIDDYINSAADTTGNARTKLNAWLERKITKDSDKALLKNEDWCIGDRTSAYIYNGSTKTYDLSTSTAEELINAGTASFYYSAYKRIYNTKTPTLKCDGSKEKDGEIDTNKVGMLTQDEISFAGAYQRNNNSIYYLNKNATANWWWALSPSNFNVANSYAFSFYVHSYGYLYSYSVDDPNSLRATVSLTSSTKRISGDGTVNNAYTVG